MQFYVAARCTNLKLALDILIGTVPLREAVHSLPTAQCHQVITSQPSSALPRDQPDIDNFSLRMFQSCNNRRMSLFLQCFDTVGWVIWPVKPVHDMTYNVFGGTISLTYSINQPKNELSFHLSLFLAGLKPRTWTETIVFGHGQLSMFGGLFVIYDTILVFLLPFATDLIFDLFEVVQQRV